MPAAQNFMPDRLINSHSAVVLLTGLMLLATIHVSEREVFSGTSLHATLMVLGLAMTLFPIVSLHQRYTAARLRLFHRSPSLRGIAMKSFAIVAAIALVTLSLVCANSDMHNMNKRIETKTAYVHQ